MSAPVKIVADLQDASSSLTSVRVTISGTGGTGVIVVTVDSSSGGTALSGITQAQFESACTALGDSIQADRTDLFSTVSVNEITAT